ncbi:MAG: inositol monophosphatase family protein [Rubellimicrobium sp.]|nr:inositol monophosphatase family protein [Rubellimicrobium sp.]
MTVIDAQTRTGLRQVAHRLADAAREVTLRHFRQPLVAEAKGPAGAGGGRFDPVTVADRESEAAMRAILSRERPGDAILGEEYGETVGETGLTWVLDPVDGTRGFICGTPCWGVLVAVADAEGPLFGIIEQPYIRERFEGGFGVAQVAGPSGTAPLRARQGRRLAEAVLLTTFPEVGTRAEHDAFAQVAGQVTLVRYGLDCYAYALLAAGQIDLVIEAGLHAYDVNAPIAVIRAAGGVVTDWQGGPAHRGGRLLAAGSPELHAEALAILSRCPA